MTISELEGGEDRASISNSTAEVDFANGVLGGPFGATRERIAGGCCGVVEAVQAARPVNGDTSRTSVSEGKAGEEESLDITQDEAGAPLCQKYTRTGSCTTRYKLRVLKYKDSQFEARKRSNASFMMIRPGFARWNSRVGFLPFPFCRCCIG